jgi:hypothetical protein
VHSVEKPSKLNAVRGDVLTVVPVRIHPRYAMRINLSSIQEKYHNEEVPDPVKYLSKKLRCFSKK